MIEQRQLKYDAILCVKIYKKLYTLGTTSRMTCSRGKKEKKMTDDV